MAGQASGRGPGSAEIEHLTARIVTRFDLEPTLPAFPTPDQIEHRPARLSYVALGDGRAAYWHTVDAGRDGTGLPGNVFAHVIAVEEQNGAVGGFAPIELWHWRGGHPVRPGGRHRGDVSTGRRRWQTRIVSGVLRWPSCSTRPVTAPSSRECCSMPSPRGLTNPTNGPVVPAVDDHDRAASWIAAVSHFSRRVRDFSWSTHDSADAVAAG